MIQLYETAASPPCRAVKMTLELLGLKYEVHKIDLAKKDQLKPEYIKMNPFHTVPTIVDNGRSIYESRAIITYLVSKYAPDSELYPKDVDKRVVVDQFLQIDAGTIFARAMDILHPYFVSQEPTEDSITRSKDALGILDGLLAKTPFVTGDTMTLADLSIVTSLSGFQMAGFDYSEFLNVKKFESRIREKLNPMYAEVNDGPIALLTDIINGMKASMKK